MSSVFPAPSRTRLVTIIAQVDHGKTTLADSLIESNGIISERLAGTLRYLDSLEEEQRRGITMRTSAIGLKHTFRRTAKDQPQDIVVHLLDSPGHTDFAPEVSSALLSCDGALLVVDAVEGLCARTHQVLREAYMHQLVPILVINKVDRLCCDLCLTPSEAYVRLRGLLESINAASAAMLVSKTADREEEDAETDEGEEALWTFEPAKGNVVFASALFGWGFTVPSLAKALFRSGTLPFKPIVLRQYLFGDFKHSNGKVLKWKGKDDADPVFAEFGLQPLWTIYEGVSAAAVTVGLGTTLFADGGGASSSRLPREEGAKIAADSPGMDMVAQALREGYTSPHSVPAVGAILSQTGSSTEESVLRAVLRRYRPLSDAVLDAVCDQCPSPDVAASTVRTRALALTVPSEPNAVGFQRIQRAVQKCDPNEPPVVAHVCKFLSTDRSHVADKEIAVATTNDSNSSTLIMGLARVLSGTLQTHEPYGCLGPKHTYGADCPRRTVRLYLLMGSSFVPVKAVPAGHLCAVYGLEDLQLKTATLCDDEKNGMPLRGFDRGVRPLVKVNVEPVLAEDTDALERALIKLSMADAAVEVTATAKGERILACLGELHLEQSIHDLETVYCGKDSIKLRISEPIVEFGETTEWFANELDYKTFYDERNARPLRQCSIPPYNEEEGLVHAKRGRMRAILSGRGAAIHLRAVPLADPVYQSLQKQQLLPKAHQDVARLGQSLGCLDQTPEQVFAVLLKSMVTVDNNGNAMMETTGLANGSCVQGIEGDELYIGTGENKEEDEEAVGRRELNALHARMRDSVMSSSSSEVETVDNTASRVWRASLRGSTIAGFQLGLRSGPVCEEPVHGVLIVLEGAEVALGQSKPLSGGMVVAALKQGIRCALLSRPVRLMESHLKLTLHSSLAGLGSLYGVLSKRRGRVLEDSMVDGTDLLLITATLPQAESFGLAPELLQKTSGQVTVPELTFWKWTKLDENPFWIPTSLEEREDFGEIVTNGDLSTGVDNTAIQYIRRVRERKGLLVDSNKTVVAAEKQRTMKR